jgi:hypothetical protein
MLRGNIVQEGILVSMCRTPDLTRQRLRWRALLVYALWQYCVRSNPALTICRTPDLTRQRLRWRALLVYASWQYY